MTKKWLFGVLLVLLLGLSACTPEATNTPASWDQSNWDSNAVWQ